MKMIYDVFLFFNEFHILDIRLHELGSVVNKFVLIESEKTHTFQDKPLYFKDYMRANPKAFEEFQSRIIHIVIPAEAYSNLSRGRDYHWVERFNRNYAINQLKQIIRPDDRMILADVDEIPEASFIKEQYNFGLVKRSILNIRMKMYRYSLNLYFQDWKGARYLRWENLGKFDWDWDDVRRNHKNVAVTTNPYGWHFSSVGTAEEILLKFKSMSHYHWLSRRGLVNKMKIEEMLTEKKHYKPQGEFFGEFRDIGDMPKYVQDNVEKFLPYLKLGEDKI